MNFNNYSHSDINSIGFPSLKFLASMELEHKSMGGADETFTTGNYQLQTTPKAEWGYVVDGVGCPHEQLKDLQGNVVRKIPDIDTLLRSSLSVKANLTRHEVIALVLYTGPMVCHD